MQRKDPRTPQRLNGGRVAKFVSFAPGADRQAMAWTSWSVAGATSVGNWEIARWSHAAMHPPVPL